MSMNINIAIRIKPLISENDENAWKYDGTSIYQYDHVNSKPIGNQFTFGLDILILFYQNTS